MSDTIVETNIPARRRLSERPERMVHREEEEPNIVVETPAALSPSDALADSQRQLQNRDRELAAERAARAEAERARQAAEQQAASQLQARSNDRLAAVTAMLEAATAEQQAAEAALESAHEAGDIKGVIAAQKQLAQATYRVASATAEQETLKQQRPPAQGQPQQPQYSPAARQWMDAHPRFLAGSQPGGSKEDQDYYAEAMAGHHAALARGYKEGSQAYFEEIDRRVAAFEANEGGEPPPRQEHRNMRDDTAPPSRGTTGPGAGWKTARVNLGQNGSSALIDYRNANGGRTIRFRNAADRENFEEGARTCFPKLYESNPDRALAEYLQDHIAHIEEGSPDLKIGDGQIYGRE